jgi:transcriptional regulator with XRE-family HTH domain
VARRWRETHACELKVAILMSGRPQYEFAKELGISDSQLSRYLHDRVSLPPEQVVKLRALLGLELETTDD